MSDKSLFEYENDEIQVTWDKNVCEHAAVCVATLPNVFDPKKKPWINVDAASTDEITSAIKKCPSGALGYTVKATGETQKSASKEKAEAIEITMFPNGPLGISGPCVVKDGNGNVVHEGNKMALCRCGLSSKKPFCDGSHKSGGFEG